MRPHVSRVPQEPRYGGELRGWGGRGGGVVGLDGR